MSMPTASPTARGAMPWSRNDPLHRSRISYVADPRASFVGGHSSGGWSSLWLQVAYPETFGGVWSTSPDPVDFRDWQGTNFTPIPIPAFLLTKTANVVRWRAAALNRS